jgi:hypothetical protein
LTQISHSSIPASWLLLQSSENDNSRPQFVKNEVVRGVVLKSISSSSVMLLIKGKRVIANTHIPLSEGSGVILKVENTNPNPILKLVKIEGETVNSINTSIILNGIKTNLWKTIIDNMDEFSLSIKEKEVLEELVSEISKNLISKPTADLLKEFIDQSGLGWENKLRELLLIKTHTQANIHELLSGDLKGLISKFITSSSGENELFNRFVSMIKNIQLLNHFGFEQDGKIFIPLPLQFSDGYFTVGQLLIQSDHSSNNRRKKNERGNGFFRISFLLELSKLGPFRADLAVQGEKISGRFLTVKDKTKCIIEKNLPSFIAAFNKRGFTILHLECHLKEPKQVSDTLIKEIVPKKSYNISLVA